MPDAPQCVEYTDRVTVRPGQTACFRVGAGTDLEHFAPPRSLKACFQINLGPTVQETVEVRAWRSVCVLRSDNLAKRVCTSPARSFKESVTGLENAEAGFEPDSRCRCRASGRHRSHPKSIGEFLRACHSIQVAPGIANYK
jgi:hypothetical protein